jgi:hypothetical protein
MNKYLYSFLFIFCLLFFSVAENIFPQSFTKITTGAVVNDTSWSYGCCWADFNSDGYIDLFVCNNMTANKNNLMYINNGNGTFTKITTGVVVTDGGSSYGCTAGDYDNDGFLDLFVSNYGENNFLYHNNGNGTFTKITTGVIVSDGGNSTGCSWGDYDNDGYVDLIVCNRNQNNFLYHNNGNGTFTRITTGPVATDNSNSGGCAWGDYNSDGYIDLFVANAGPASDFLYRNNGNGTFTKITNDPVVIDVEHSGGGSWGDYDNDGDLDLFVTGGVIGTSFNRLFRNNGNGTFTKVTGDPIVTYSHWAGGAGWCDFDNDSDLDMYVSGYDGINLLYANNGNGSFTRIDTGVVVNDGGYKMGASWGDYNNDGFVDLFVARNNFYGGNNVMYLNNGNGNKWINIRCVGMVSNKAGIGAKVFIRSTINSVVVRQMQVVSSQTGGAISGQGSLNADFGLGNATIIDSIRIEWPSGIIDKYTNVPVSQFRVAIEGQGLTPVVNVNNNNVPNAFSLYQNYPNPFNPATKIKFDVPRLLSPLYERGVGGFVVLKVFDVLGNEVTTLISQQLKPGSYEIEFNGASYSSGVYYYQLKTDGFVETKKLILLK